MFVSKKRTVVIPQHEHGRMSGMIASLWGNETFDRPRFDFDAFVMGVTLHDWGYGLIDNLPIGSAPEEDWLSVIRQGYRHPFEHPVTDVIVKLHIRRLLGFKESPDRTEAITELDSLIAHRLEESGFSLDEFNWADRITNLCDYIAFYFAFEEPIDKTFTVHPKTGIQNTIDIRIKTNLDGMILVDPWPFAVSSYQGFIFAYQQEGYPDRLNPVMRTFRIRSGDGLLD